MSGYSEEESSSYQAKIHKKLEMQKKTQDRKEQQEGESQWIAKLQMVYRDQVSLPDNTAVLCAVLYMSVQNIDRLETFEFTLCAV